MNFHLTLELILLLLMSAVMDTISDLLYDPSQRLQLIISRPQQQFLLFLMMRA